MSRKHNCKHDRSPSRYKKRLQDRGLSRTPVMTYTGMSYVQLQQVFARLPHYRWTTVQSEEGGRFQRRVQV